MQATTVFADRFTLRVTVDNTTAACVDYRVRTPTGAPCFLGESALAGTGVRGTIDSARFLNVTDAGGAEGACL